MDVQGGLRMDLAGLHESPAGSGASLVGETDDRDADGRSEITEETDVKNKEKMMVYEKLTEELDPRIQEELERLNEGCEKINQLELELHEVRSSHRRIMNESVLKLKAMNTELGSCIEKARPYYEARRKAKQVQQETQKAALRFKRAVSSHLNAREMVRVAEQGLTAVKTLEPTWQEMLNHATSMVNEAEAERVMSECEHMRVMQLCQEAETRVQDLQKSLRRVILKSKPYFELKNQFNDTLEERKSKIMKLEELLSKAKINYSNTLRHLEQISEEIRAQREQDQTSNGSIRTCGGRSPPVGAEAISSSTGAEDGGHTRASDEVDGEVGVANAKEWAETRNISRWEDMGRAEMMRSDAHSSLSLQTFVSDGEKCDSAERLCSDVSFSGGERETDGVESDQEPVRPISNILQDSSNNTTVSVCEYVH